MPLLAAVMCQSCLEMNGGDPYAGDLHLLTVELLVPEGDDVPDFTGVTVRLREVNSDAEYSASCDAAGKA